MGHVDFGWFGFSLAGGPERSGEPVVRCGAVQSVSLGQTWHFYKNSEFPRVTRVTAVHCGIVSPQTVEMVRGASGRPEMH